MSTASSWAEVPCLGFDLESTGVNAHQDRIVQAAVVSVKPGVDPVKFTWLADPGVPIPDEAAAVHGITSERARAEGQDIGQVLFELTGRLALWLGKGFPIAGFNLAYDLTMLEAENRRHGIDTLASRLPKGIGPVIDAMVLDKYADGYRKGICAQDRKNPCQCGATDKKLTSLCLHYGVPLGDDAHDATADALAAALLWPRIIARHPEKFRGFTVGALHQGQIRWRKEQMDSLRSYFDRQGTEHDGCDPSWPLLRQPATQTTETQGALL
jgi:DNA polymerase III subunit epsilon